MLGMACRKHALLEPTDDWQQLQLHLDWARADPR